MALDEEAQLRFTQLWTDAQPAVAAYLRAVVRDVDLAKDIVQETAIVLLRKFGQWDSEREFLPWALGVAKFQVLAHRRDMARSRVVFDEALLDAITDSWPSAMAKVSREQAILEECLETLAPKARQIVRLRFFHEMNIQEVAEKIGASYGATCIAMMRIRRSLQDCVQRRLGLSEVDFD